MPDPKISRRCPTCRASIRDNAFFCPQCGNKLDRPPMTPAQQEEIHDTEEVVIDPTKTLTEADFRARSPKQSATVEAKPAKAKALGEVGSKLQKVTNKARGVEGDVKQRVQKFRQMSNVVIGEANYDPSLRFVLVVVALFIVFLLIVLLNKVID